MIDPKENIARQNAATLCCAIPAREHINERRCREHLLYAAAGYRE